MRIEFHKVVAYSPRTASRAFDPPCGERVIRRAIADGVLTVTKVGQRSYILRDDLIDAAKEGKLQ